MRSFSPELLSLMASQEIVARNLIRFDLGSGAYGLTDDVVNLDFEGLTYRPGANLLDVEAIGGAVGMAAVGLVVRLASRPNSDLTPTVLATIEQEDYIGRLATLHRQYRLADGTHVQTIRMWRGTIDRLTHEEQPGGTAALVANLESRALDFQKSGHRVFGPADQAAVDPTDRFFEHAATAGTVELFWGRKP